MSNLIIDIQEKFGAELHTRQMVERLAASLNAADSYLLDWQCVAATECEINQDYSKVVEFDHLKRLEGLPNI